MSWTEKHRRMLAGLVMGLSLLAPARLAGQELDDVDTPLGDVARNLRKQLPASQHAWQHASQQEIIDNDNLTKVMDDVDSHRAARSSLMYSIHEPGKAFQVSVPDVTCSLSFNANVKSLLASSYVQMELPADQLLKLSGPATIHGDSLEVSVFNGTQWHVSEVAVALTIVTRNDFPEAAVRPGSDGLAKMVPAAAIEPLQEPGSRSENDSDRSDSRAERRPDTAVLYHMRAAAAPFGVTVFATPLNVEIGPGQEWHWAIVQAKGYPPQQNVSKEAALETLLPAASLQPISSQSMPLQPSQEAPVR